MASQRELIDWHTHVWKPDHMTAQAHADMHNHGVVVSGAAAPEDHKREVADGGADKFAVINAPVALLQEGPQRLHSRLRGSVSGEGSRVCIGRP